MTILQAVILGLVQGLTEFIPVSSSGHLVLVPWLFEWDLPEEIGKTFDVALHIGTFFAVLIYFRIEVGHLLQSAWKTLRTRRVETFEDRLPWLLVFASIPAALVGLVGEGYIEEYLDQPIPIAITLSVFAVVMLWVDRGVGTRGFDDTGWGDAAFIGVGQALALWPGTSRSGVTLAAGIYRGFTREAAVRFSFLMSLPVIAGAGSLKGVELAFDGFPEGAGPSIFLVGMLTSFVSGYFAVAWMLRFLRTGTLTPFAVYRFGLSALVIFLIAVGARPATT